MKRVLVAPLDWGLGHASRCIPVIRLLLQKQCEVILAGAGDSLKLLQNEFPTLPNFYLPGYRPRYPVSGELMVWKMALQAPHFFSAIQKEHRVIEDLIKKEKISLVISDNRYGLWSAHTPCIFITHQSNILMPRRFGWLQGIVMKLNNMFMRRFTRCWIPDYPNDHSLAGNLIAYGETSKALEADFIGSLSRFKKLETQPKLKYDILAVFSGPEPQRSILEGLVVPQLKASGLKYFFVRGVFSSSALQEEHAVNFSGSMELQQLIESSEVILARSGYSTVMDLAALQKKAIFIPTPGQTEQEYLAQYLSERHIAFSIPQHSFNLPEAWKEVKKYRGFQPMPDNTLLEKAVTEALARAK